MKWNYIGFGKAIFIVLFTIFSYFQASIIEDVAIQPMIVLIIGALIGWTIFGTLIIYVIVKFFGGKIKKPNWNDNPLRLKEPLIFMQFAGIAVLIFGLANLTGSLVQHSDINVYGFQNVFSGIGLLASIEVSKKIITGTNMP